MQNCRILMKILVLALVVRSITHPLIHMGYSKNRIMYASFTTLFLGLLEMWVATPLILVLLPPTTGLRMQVVHEQDETSCIPCLYPELLDDICFPQAMTLLESRWICNRHEREKIDNDDGMWDCLLTGTDSATCTDASQGSCIWCAEPVYGLCVTPDVAAKLRYLPFFYCDNPITVTN